MAYRKIDVRPVAGALGAEIDGVDLSRPLDEETMADIRQALAEHLVIFLRDQTMTPDQHKAFGKRFGTLNIHQQYVPLDGHPEILPILKEATDTLNIGGVWHSDVSFMKQPAMGSILYALDVPAHGGDTLFANQYLAYETLSAGMRAMLDGMKAVHSDKILSDPVSASERNDARSTRISEDAMRRGEVTNEHPVIRTHPDTGRRGLYVNVPFTIRFAGMTEAESMPLLKFLHGHATRPEFTCRFTWKRHSVAFWDNRCTQHFAVNDYQGQRREMHRVTVNGQTPV